MGKLFERFDSMRKFLINLFVIIGIVVLCIASWKEFNKNYYEIKPFDVPMDFQKYGYTGKVVASKLLDNFHDINLMLKTKMERKGYDVAKSEQLDNVKIPETNISFGLVIRYMKQLFSDQNKTITGEIFRQNDYFYLTSRLNGTKMATTSIKWQPTLNRSEIDSLLFYSSLNIYKEIEPYIVAAYFYEKGKLNESIETIKICLTNQNQNDDTWALNLWGTLLNLSDKPNEAIVKFNQAIELNPKKVRFAYSNIAISYEMLKDTTKAIENYKKALEFTPNDPYANNSFGLFYHKSKNYDLAINYYKKAMEADPSNFRTLTNIGEIKIKLEEYQEAVQYLKKAIKLNRNFARSYINLGQAYEGLNKIDDAILQYELAIYVKPEPELASLAHFLIGLNYLKTGKTHQSIKHFRESIDLNPNFFDAYEYLIKVYDNIRNPDEARNLLSQYKKVQNNQERIAIFEKRLDKAKLLFNE